MSDQPQPFTTPEFEAGTAITVAQTISRLEAARAQAAAQVEALRTANGAMTLNLEDRRRALDSASRRIDSLVEEVDRLGDELHRVTHERDDVRRELQAQIADGAELHRELALHNVGSLAELERRLINSTPPRLDPRNLSEPAEAIVGRLEAMLDQARHRLGDELAEARRKPDPYADLDVQLPVPAAEALERFSEAMREFGRTYSAAVRHDLRLLAERLRERRDG